MKEIDIQKWGFAIPVALVIALATYMFLHRNDMPALMQNHLERQFNGKVEHLFRDDRDHNVKKAVLDNGYVYSMPPQWERLIEVGDSLSKKKNALKLEVYRQGQPKMVLDYHDTYKKEKR